MSRAILRGILWAFLGIFPAAIAVGTVYHFPVPFRGEVSGAELFPEGPNGTAELVWMILQAVVYYTLWGGFVLLAMLGIVAGMLSWWLGSPDKMLRYTRNIALGLDLLAAITLAVLDKIVGAW
jgi:hypothetical protein